MLEIWILSKSPLFLQLGTPKQGNGGKESIHAYLLITPN